MDGGDHTQVDAAGIALAAHDIRFLVRWSPERLLWAPGRPIWGIALIRGSERAIVAIDGCLNVAMTIWPNHYRPGARYPLDSIVRVLANTMGIKRLDGSSMFTCPLPQAVSGSCCVIVTQEELPWLSPDLPVLPLADQVEWLAPEQPPATTSLVVLHPWMSMAGLRPACATAAEFLSTVGEPPEMQYLPLAPRRDRLLSFWRLQLLHERERLRLAEQDLPGWIEDEATLLSCAEAWISGWRGPREPAAPPRPPAAEAAPASVPVVAITAAAAQPQQSASPFAVAPEDDGEDSEGPIGGGTPWG